MKLDSFIDQFKSGMQKARPPVIIFCLIAIGVAAFTKDDTVKASALVVMMTNFTFLLISYHDSNIRRLERIGDNLASIDSTLKHHKPEEYPDFMALAGDLKKLILTSIAQGQKRITIHVIAVSARYSRDFIWTHMGTFFGSQ